MGRCVIPGRAFTRRLYMYTKGSGKSLKPHHHIKVNPEIKKDVLMWQSLVQHPSVYSRPFIDFEDTLQAEQICMFSDASRNPLLGFGCICENSWTYAQWPKIFVEQFEPSIEFLELYAVVVTVVNWLNRFKNKRIMLHCDNQAVVSMVNNNTLSCKQCLALIRVLVMHSMTLNSRVFAKYLSSKSNKDADLLSRLIKKETHKPMKP